MPSLEAAETRSAVLKPCPILLVLDPKGTPIPNAALSIETSRGSLSERTNAEGAHHLAACDDMLDVKVEASGYAPEHRHWRPPHPDVLVVVLSEAQQILGRVVRFDSHLPIPHAKVVVWPVDEGVPSVGLIQDLAEGRVIPGRTALSDGDGKFVLTGARSETEYRIVAAAEGWLSVGANARSSDETTLLAKPVYAMRFTLIDSVGSMLSGAELSASPLGVSVTGKVPGLQFIGSYARFAVLAGYPPGEPLASSGADHVWILEAEEDASTCGPFTASGHPVLCDPFKYEVWAWRLGKPRAPDALVVEQSSGVAAGEVVLLPQGVGSGVPEDANVGGLTFQGKQTTFTAPLTGRDLVRRRVLSVPRDTYSLTFQSALQGSRVLIADEVEVGAEPVQVPLDLSMLGGVRITLYREDGSLELNSVRAVVGRGDEKALGNGEFKLSGTVLLNGPVAELSSILPGDYLLIPTHGYPRTRVLLEAGQVVEISMRQGGR